MKSFMVLMPTIAIAVLAGCTPQTQAPAQDTAAMVASANELDQRFVEALNSGDVEAIAACYWNSPEAVTFPPDMMEARGQEAIRSGFQQMFTTMPGARIELTETHQIPAGDMVMGWGLWRLTMNGPDGKPMEVSGRFTDVKAERDGKWVYLVDHASVPMAAAGDESPR